LIKKTILFFYIFFFCFYNNSVQADIKQKIIDKFNKTETLTFNFKQKVGEKVEKGVCFIKYPLLMKCNYENSKQKTIISNGKTVAIIKKKYKKIYYHPIKTTPLFTILKKEKILDLIINSKPTILNSELIFFEFVSKKNKIKIFFDKKTLNFKGWATKDAYSNDVNFIISKIKKNNQIVDNFFKIPREEDL